MGKRRKSRTIALQSLYMLDSATQNLDQILRYEWLEERPDKATLEFSSSIISKTIDTIDTIDEIIKKYAKNWKFERIEKIDKTILRMAICEILYFDDIPSNVTLNEAIELGKEFGGENSGTFINGILDSVVKHEQN